MFHKVVVNEYLEVKAYQIHNHLQSNSIKILSKERELENQNFVVKYLNTNKIMGIVNNSKNFSKTNFKHFLQ